MGEDALSVVLLFCGNGGVDGGAVVEAVDFVVVVVVGSVRVIVGAVGIIRHGCSRIDSPL